MHLYRQTEKRVGDALVAVYLNATYADVREGDSIRHASRWHRVISSRAVSEKLVALTLLDLTTEDTNPLHITMPYTSYVPGINLHRPLGCLDAPVVENLLTLCRTNWGSFEQKMHAAQVRVVPRWERANAFGRNWLTTGQANHLYDAARRDPTLNWPAKLAELGVTVIQLPDTALGDDVDLDLRSVVDDLSSVIGTLRQHGGGVPQIVVSGLINRLTATLQRLELLARSTPVPSGDDHAGRSR